MRLAALLHDAPEYVIGDMISPFKAAIGGDYKLVEARLMQAIHIRFGLPAALAPELVTRIKAADRVSAYMEATALAGFEAAEARKLFGAPDLPLGPFAAYLEPLRPSDVEARFLARFHELDAAAACRRDKLIASDTESARAEVARLARQGGETPPLLLAKRNSMPRLHVCSLALVAAIVEKTGARSLVTLLRPDGTVVERPAAIAPERHLTLAISDIVAPTPGQTLADETHIDDLIGFVCDWDRAEPMLIHCFAGVSRSTAAAFIAACALNPARDERDVARALRAASPTATPNAHLVALADAALGRGGRMSEAIAEIGRGEECFEGLPFVLELG